ncbi:hypothetical protein J2787_000864 [Chryseobacterium rhizosphaerae]|uniref:Uncharacterized protein n=1 Tax=Chryseobacterium rhizosphaerae TaxID=395937 RepID=A0AAE3Y7T4_9FLAO|nr:hypothetical protein [Chryseobacterium rhizosphaerae]
MKFIDDKIIFASIDSFFLFNEKTDKSQISDKTLHQKKQYLIFARIKLRLIQNLNLLIHIGKYYIKIHENI